MTAEVAVKDTSRRFAIRLSRRTFLQHSTGAGAALAAGLAAPGILAQTRAPIRLGHLNSFTGGIAYAGMRQALKIDATWVPYKGTNDVITAVMGGQIDVGLIGGSEQRFVDLMKAGKIKILGVLSEKAAGPYATSRIPTAMTPRGFLTSRLSTVERTTVPVWPAGAPCPGKGVRAGVSTDSVTRHAPSG